jgi:hypothetical protein
MLQLCESSIACAMERIESRYCIYESAAHQGCVIATRVHIFPGRSSQANALDHVSVRSIKWVLR